MKILLKILLGVFVIALIGYAVFYFKNESIKKKEMSNILIKSFFSVQGMANTVTIFNDKSFIEDKNPIDIGKSCNKGVISDVDYNSFISYLKSTDFMKKKIDQSDDSSLICEAVSSLTVSLDGKINKISSVCAREDSVQTKETFKLVQEIETKMEELIKKSPKSVCL